MTYRSVMPRSWIRLTNPVSARRLVTMRAARWGTTRRPERAATAQNWRVRSNPNLGEQVMATVASAGVAWIWSWAPLSGITSIVAAAMRRPVVSGFCGDAGSMIVVLCGSLGERPGAHDGPDFPEGVRRFDGRAQAGALGVAPDHGDFGAVDGQLLVDHAQGGPGADVDGVP